MSSASVETPGATDSPTVERKRQVFIIGVLLLIGTATIA